jgi:hypothetical protein
MMSQLQHAIERHVREEEQDVLPKTTTTGVPCSVPGSWPWVSRARRSRAMVVFPVPPFPARRVSIPKGQRRSHAHSVRSGLIWLARRLTT